MRDRYISVMKDLCQHPIKSPSIADFKKVFPHLNDEEIIKIRKNGEYVACPPTIVTHSFMVIQYNKERDELRYAFPSRTREAYADHKLHGDIDSPDAYMQEAMNYANQHWGKSLIVDNWVDFQKIYIQDPSEKTQGLFGGYPKTKAQLFVAYNRAWNELINDHSKPESDLIDESIAFLTTDKFVADNIKGGRGGYTEFNCACCGGGLGLTNCYGCNRTFKDDEFRCGWETPLSAKMTDYLQQQGFVFKTDPAIARANEREIWQHRMEHPWTKLS